MLRMNENGLLGVALVQLELPTTGGDARRLQKILTVRQLLNKNRIGR